MGIESLGWALRQQPDDPLQKLLLLILADAEPRDYLAIYDMNELAEAACSTVEAVIDALDRLEGLDLVTWHWHGDGETDYLAVTFHQASPEQRNVKGPPQGFLYVFDGRDRAGEHVWCKVGVTRDVDRRLRALHKDSHPGWRLHATWRLPMADGQRVLERLREKPMRLRQSEGWHAMPAAEAAASVVEVLGELGLTSPSEAPAGRPH